MCGSIPNGDVTILIGTQSSGQGHQTAYAQLVAEQFGLAPERVHTVQGDTDQVATGLGTGGSASIPTGGVSVERATRQLGTRLKEIAAEALETSPGDLEIDDGTVRIAGTDRSISFADLAGGRASIPRGSTPARRSPARTAPIPMAPISPRSRSTRPPASSGS